MLHNKKMAVLYLIAIFFIAIDRFFKALALQDNIEYNIIGELFKFKFAANPNIAFSLPLSGLFLNILIPLLVIVISVLYWKLIKNNEKIEAYAFFLILLGAISNYIDRIKEGYVIDYLDLEYFTVFNVADAMIVLGVFFVILKSLRK